LFDKADIAQKLGYVEDAKRAKALAHKLAETCERFFDHSNAEIDWTQLKKACKIIVNEAKKTLLHYDFWQVLMSNFLLAVTGLCVLKAAITGSFFLHNLGKACYEEIENTYKIVKIKSPCVERRGLTITQASQWVRLEPHAGSV